jgi:hypothetical protein
MRLKPDFNLESIYEIEAETLKECGIKGIFFDLDSTVMKSKSGFFTEKTCEFLDALSKDFKIAIITNNTNKKYIAKVCTGCKFHLYSNAKKPDIRVIRNALNDLGLAASETALVGDRPLTDILAGKRADMLTILVDSISKHDEHAVVRAVRWLERLTIKKVT